MRLFIAIFLFTIFAFGLSAQKVTTFIPSLMSFKAEYGMTMSPDKKLIYFVQKDSFYKNKPQRILFAELKRKQWTTPQTAPFSGNYSDSSPFISPDGKQLFFTSNRPAPGISKQSSNIWVLDLTQPGSAPAYLPGVNSEVSAYSPTVDKEGNLYFGSYREGGQGWGDLWMARFVDGQYQEPENLGPMVNTKHGEWGSCIDPNGKYIIFEASGIPGNLSGSGDLLISYKKDGAWQAPVHFDPPINSLGSDLTPRIHGKHLYFASNRAPDYDPKVGNNNVDLYRIKLKALLKQANKKG